MAGPISKHPEGLLDLLGIKFTGKYPVDLVEQVLPVIDIQRLVLDSHAVEANAAVVAAFAATATASSVAITSAQWLTVGNVDLANGAASTVVPAGEIWLVLEGAVIWAFSANAGQEIDMTMIIRGVAPTSTSIPIAMSDLQGFSTSAAAPARTGQRSILRPFILTPGQELRAQHAGVTVPAGSISYNVNVRVARLGR